MNRNETEEPQKLIEILQKSLKKEWGILWVSTMTFIIYVLFDTILNEYSDKIDIVIRLLVSTLAAYLLFRKRADTKTLLIYIFREQYEELIRKLNFGPSQKGFSLETLENRARSFLESRASTIEDMEKSFGRISDQAEQQRKHFREDHAFYKSFGLASDSYDPYFKKEKFS